MERDTIFIGHATPEDNEFTLWLQSKLINEGYKCECDLSLLLGGEADYWKKLQDFLNFNTSKYILVVSKDTFEKQGVLDEWEHCRSIERQNLIQDFIIPIKIDDSRFNARIGLNRRNIISFEGFWGSGLKRLLKKLAADNVPKLPAGTLSLKNWYENVYTNWSGIEEDKVDLFYSNWVEITRVPPKVRFYQFRNDDQAKAIIKNNLGYPAIRHGSIIVTFQATLNYYLDEINDEIPPQRVIIKDTSDTLSSYDTEEFPTYQDFRRLLVRLLKECFDSHLQQLELKSYELASKTKCFYFEGGADKHIKGKFKIGDTSKNITVTGKYYEAFWHYGISFKPLFYPQLCFSIKNHIVFTDDGIVPWEDKKKMHSARRNKGKNMRNKEWRDCLLAFLASIKNADSDNIEIEVSPDEKLVMPATPIMFQASFSYIEPNDEERLASIDTFIDEEEYFDETETTEENV
ncbi:MAG: toll/interleukin-1 receptor domain-containing protein [Bacteroidetes bacterium]|nr:toll/interleukin-1 receptor domain-containing protein [Bacteroidota bacterium]